MSMEVGGGFHKCVGACRKRKEGLIGCVSGEVNSRCSNHCIVVDMSNSRRLIIRGIVVIISQLRRWQSAELGDFGDY